MQFIGLERQLEADAHQAGWGNQQATQFADHW
jgi:hypothetical protein